MITNKTIKSKYQPKQTNVTWVDLNGKTPVEKHFINGKWREMSGGGAGSSNPTEADATKVWQVTPVKKGTQTKETVIVPEQTLVNDQDLEYNDKFVPGAQCVAVVNGIEYRGEVIKEKLKDDIYYKFENFIYYTDSGAFKFTNNTELDEVIAKLSVIEETPIYDYNWAPGVKIPIPTAEDEGKILVVNEVEVSSEEYELAPNQTVTIIENSVTLQNTSNLDKFVEGATVISVIDGTTYTGQVVNGKNLYVELYDGNTTWNLDLVEDGGEAELTLFSYDPGTYEFSVSVVKKNILMNISYKRIVEAKALMFFGPQCMSIMEMK